MCPHLGLQLYDVFHISDESSHYPRLKLRLGPAGRDRIALQAREWAVAANLDADGRLERVMNHSRIQTTPVVSMSEPQWGLESDCMLWQVR